jgi:hypothetical protein
MRGLRIVSVLLCLWSALTPAHALAEPATDAYHAAVAGAYRHYREAVHCFENDNAELGALALEEFQNAWSVVIRKYADDPPPSYAGDATFKDTLIAIRTRAEVSAKQVGNVRTPILLQTLRQIQARLAYQRERNGQRIYSDCVDRMNEAMLRLWMYRQTPPHPGKPDSIIRFKTAVYETALWYRQCRDEAPAALRESEEFRRLFDGALASLAKLEAVDLAHTDALVSILRELHSFDRLIWLKFG